ncbi:MAG UNVERIFIED_CONTAM: hypothetical protein LVT10_16655 [Anaerolineae bacterium]
MKSIFIAFIVGSLFVLVSSTLAQTPDLIGPESYPEGINPLTGLPFPDPSATQRRPIVVKISNSLP